MTENCHTHRFTYQMPYTQIYSRWSWAIAEAGFMLMKYCEEQSISVKLCTWKLWCGKFECHVNNKSHSNLSKCWAGETKATKAVNVYVYGMDSSDTHVPANSWSPTRELNPSCKLQPFPPQHQWSGQHKLRNVRVISDQVCNVLPMP